MAKSQGGPCIINHWIPDGAKDYPADRWTHRALLTESLDAGIIGEKTVSKKLCVDYVESKLFGLGSEDYAGFRLYAPGDSPRRIAWKAATRGGPLLVKQFTDQARPELWLDWRLLGIDSVEPRLAQLCQWVLKAESEGRRYGLLLPGAQIPPAQGDAHRRRCLEALALF